MNAYASIKPPTPAPLRGSPWPSVVNWFALAMLLVILAGLGLRYGTNILDYPHVRDERLMKVPIDDIVTHGWSIETAINYQEVKGPAFFWPYALGAQVIQAMRGGGNSTDPPTASLKGGGVEMNDLRLISTLFFIGGAIPLLLIAHRCGARRWTLPLVALFYVLLPYNAWVAQMLMSEPSFNFVALWMMWAFVWGFDRTSSDRETASSHSPLTPIILFTILLSILLHHRPQAVALAGAAALVAFERDGLRSWPWILACIIAGLSRLPLWLHWGGLVTSDYQGLFAFGFRLDPLTYLLAAMVPLIAIFIWPVLTQDRYRRHRRWLAVGGVIGATFGGLFSPDLYARVAYQLVTMEAAATQPVHMGVIATGVKTLLPQGFLQHVAVALLAGVGGASLAAMLLVAWSRSALTSDGVVRRLAFWMLAAGAPLYTITAGPVYDRYLAVWIILLPVVWVIALPRGAIIAQGILTAAMMAYFVNENLM